jgi:hypothetical protein
VLAAAIRAGAQVIVTADLDDFPADALTPNAIEDGTGRNVARLVRGVAGAPSRVHAFVGVELQRQAESYSPARPRGEPAGYFRRRVSMRVWASRHSA